MPLALSSLPYPTPVDPVEDPPGSIDPLGLFGHADRLADEFLPAFRQRMWQPRFLTFATVCALVSERVAERLGDQPGVRLSARLALERLYVSSMVRLEDEEGEGSTATRSLPGVTLARRAYRTGEPVTLQNFLKGQAINGPSGVLLTLARDAQLVERTGHQGSTAYVLLNAWAHDEALPGLLAEDSDQDGASWLQRVVKRTRKLVEDPVGAWPRAKRSSIWADLHCLRPDRIGPRERKALLEVLRQDPVRARVFTILQEQQKVIRTAQTQDEQSAPGRLEQTVLRTGVVPSLEEDPLDHTLKAVLEAVDAYEQASALAQQVFDALLWGLGRAAGRAKPEALVGTGLVRDRLAEVAAEAPTVRAALSSAIDGLRETLNKSVLFDPLTELAEDLAPASDGLLELAGAVLERHERVQQAKRKGLWIDRGETWCLLRGQAQPGQEPVRHLGRYLHGFRVPNAHAFLTALEPERWNAP